jgi:hypothetical protein
MALIGLAAAATAAAVALSTSLTPAANPASTDSCTWRLASVRLYQELAGETSPRAVQLRKLLAGSGVGAADFVPAKCKAAPRADSPDTTSAGSASSSSSGGSKCASTAADKFGWGRPNRTDDFSDPSSLKDWGLYDGPGHAGNGIRSPKAASVADGLLTITGDDNGTSEGMAWNPGQKYGRWEGCVKSPKSASAYHSLLLLWPDAENFPEGGEVDFMEIGDALRQTVDMFLHFGSDNSQEQGDTKVDATQWHSWAVEWTPAHIAAYVDGKQWYETTDTSHLPPGPMHLCIQLDYFPDGASAQGGGQELVDWVRQYPATGTTASSGSSDDDATSSDSRNSDSADSDSGNSESGSYGSGSAGGSRSSDDSSGN